MSLVAVALAGSGERMKYGEATFYCTVQMNHDDLERWREFCEQLNRSQSSSDRQIDNRADSVKTEGQDG